jgi:hypothetical protein
MCPNVMFLLTFHFLGQGAYLFCMSHSKFLEIVIQGIFYHELACNLLKFILKAMCACVQVLQCVHVSKCVEVLEARFQVMF